MKKYLRAFLKQQLSQLKKLEFRQGYFAYFSQIAIKLRNNQLSK